MAEPEPKRGLSPASVGASPASPPALATIRGFPCAAGHLDLDVHVGDIIHLRGGNGSGKTSLLRGLAGLAAPLQAQACLVQGHDPRLRTGAELARMVRSVWASTRETLVGLTVEGEFRLRGVPMPSDLHQLASRDAATLSSGEAQRVSLAAAAASQAPLLLLDEPCTTLDASGLARLDALVRDAAARGAVLVADHSEWAATRATRTAELGPVTPSIPSSLPRPPPGAVLITAPQAGVLRGTSRIALPTISVGPGFHVVTGRNGAGKSTLLQRLAGLRDSADVLVGQGPPRPGADVRLLQPGAGELLMEPSVRAELTGATDPEGLVGQALLDRHPLSLSAGEAQRVALVKVLGRPSPVHLLDEPDAHLDADARGRLVAAIARRLAEGGCVLAATHDAGLIAAAHTRTEVGA